MRRVIPRRIPRQRPAWSGVTCYPEDNGLSFHAELTGLPIKRLQGGKPKMRFQTTRTVVAVAVLALVAQTASAQLIETSVLQASNEFDVTEPIGEATELASTSVSIEDQLSAFEARLAALETRPMPCSTVKRDCGPVSSMRVSTNSIGRPNTYAGFEIAVLKPHVGALSGNILGLGAGSVTSTFDYDVAPRIYLGHERCDGLGVRATYFQYDHTTEASPLGVTTGLEIHALDLEATSRLKFCGSNALISAGFRYAKLEQAFVAAGLGTLDFESEGGGLTIGGQLTRDLGRTDWDLVIASRSSILFTDNYVAVSGIGSGTSEESTMKVLEARIGVRKQRELRSGALATLELAFEAQNWESPILASTLANDISLFGPTFRLGFNF